MKAVAIHPKEAGSLHLRDVPEPDLEQVQGGRGVLVKVLCVGVDGTDRELLAAQYGEPPAGDDFLVLGHECVGQVVGTGPKVWEVAPGDYVIPTVRRPGHSFYDLIGRYDMTTDDEYYERGIQKCHGFLTEYFVDAPEFLVRFAGDLGDAGVLTEPLSIVEKGIAQAYEIERARLGVWRPKRAAVLGAGPVGLLAAMALRARGLQVVSFARARPPYRNSELLSEIGARYESTEERSLEEVTREEGSFDLIFEATGFSPLAFEAMHRVGKNGVVVLSSVTGGTRGADIPSDEINQSMVLGNKVAVGTVNAGRDHFELAVADLARAQTTHPGWLGKLLTHPVSGLEDYQRMMQLLTEARDAIKVYVHVAEAEPKPG